MNGPGRALLTAANNYGGPTTITAGTLALGPSGAIGGGGLTINPGGVWDVSAYGPAGYNFNGGVLTAGRTAAQGIDVNGSLNVSSASLALAAPNSTMTIGGNLSLTSATINYYPGSIIALAGGGSLSQGGGDYVNLLTPLNIGTYTIVTGGSVPANPASYLTVTGDSSGRQSYAFNVTAGTAVTLTVSGTAGNLRWFGGSNGTWDNAASQNWYNLSTSAADYFFTGDNVTFNDTPGTATSVNIGATVQPGSVTVSNTNANYTFGGGGSITGLGALVKNGPGSLTIDTANSYTGGTSLNNGLLNLGNQNALGTGPLTISGGSIDNTSGSLITLSGGAVNVNGGFTFVGSNPLNTGTGAVTLGAAPAVNVSSGTLTVGGSISGPYGLTMTGTGMMVLGASNNYTGSTVVNGGVLQLGSSAGIPDGATVMLNGGAASAGTIDVNGFSVNFGGISGTAGSVPGMITNGAFGSGGTLTVGDNNASTTFSGVVADGNSALGLTKTGSGTLTLAGSNAYSGDTTVAQGILVLTNTAAIGNTSAGTNNLFVNAGGELQLPVGAATSVGNVYVAGSGVSVLGAAINGGTLNVTGGSVTMNGSSGTAIIGSPTVLSAGATILASANANQTLLFGSALSTTGGVTTSGSGNFVFGGGTSSVAGTFQEGNSNLSRTAVVSVLPGSTLNVGTYYVPYFSNLTVGGTMNAGAFYTANGTAGQTFINGSGVINAATWVTSGGGTARFSNGVLNVSGSFAVAPAVPAIGATLAGTFEQDSGTVNVTGTGDGFAVGFSDASHGNGAYTQFGGVLNVPNEYVELCYEDATGGNSYFQVLGTATTANVYGISFGQTVNNGEQDGNGTVKLGNAGTLLVIGAGGIVSATAGSAQIFLGISNTGGGTLASSAPWSTSLSMTVTGSVPTNIDASGGTITLDGTLGSTGGIEEIGGGVLVLGGTNTYTGGTTVASGELIVTDNEGIADGTNVCVGGELSLFGNAVAATNAGAASAPSATAVPEPGTVALLAAGLGALWLLRRRGRR